MLEPGVTFDTVDLRSKIHASEDLCPKTNFTEGETLEPTEMIRVQLRETETCGHIESSKILWVLEPGASSALASYTLHATLLHRYENKPVVLFPSGAMCLLDADVLAKVLTLSESAVERIYAYTDELGLAIILELEDDYPVLYIMYDKSKPEPLKLAEDVTLAIAKSLNIKP